jgi:hypothetical protein
MHLKLLLVAALAAIIAAAPTPAPNNDFDDGNIYTKYEDLVSLPKSS